MHASVACPCVQSYVCAQFLINWKDQLVSEVRVGRDVQYTGPEFQELVLFLQKLPTSDWTGHKLEMLLSDAFTMRALYDDARAHWRG